MKLLLSFFIAAAIIITASGQTQKNYPYYDSVKVHRFPDQQWIPFADTPKIKYLRFYTIRIDTTDYQRSIDTLLIVKDIIGGRLFYDDALFWQNAALRALQRIDSRVQVDSVKIQGGRK